MPVFFAALKLREIILLRNRIPYIYVLIIYNMIDIT